MRVCNYRRCKNNITSKRKDTKYCCDNCRNIENKYIARENKKVENQKKEIVNLLKMLDDDKMGNDVRLLFDLIKNKK